MREFPSQPLAGVGVVVLRPGADGVPEVLLIRRGSPPLEGLWSVPGGLIELGETARAAAAREVREETGLEVEVGEAFAQVDRIERAADGRVQYHYVLTEFPARPSGGSLAAGSDAGAVRWVPWAALPDYPLTPGLQPILLKARMLY